MMLLSRRSVAITFLLVASAVLFSRRATAQTYVPATSSTCDLGDISDAHDTTRFNPEWAPINIDPDHPLPNNVPNILEGFVTPVPNDQTQNSQSSTEVSEEEVPWNHYTHDYTFKVVPDPNYQYLLSSWNRLTQDVKFTNPDASDTLCNLVGATYIGNQTCSFATEET